MFRDRSDAGQQLATRLGTYRDKDVVVLALPRGGVVLGAEVAQHLGAPLDIIAPRKIGHPLHTEYAIGVVDEKGERILNELEASGIDQQWLEEETRRQEEEATRRVEAYRGGRPPVELAGKVVLLVDDGIATGLTMQLAVRSVKQRRPEKIIVAVPVAPPEALQMLAGEGAEVVCLEPPERFRGAVGAHYERFTQVEDDEVIALLKNG